jgi:hypothetical protein
LQSLLKQFKLNSPSGKEEPSPFSGKTSPKRGGSPRPVSPPKLPFAPVAKGENWGDLEHPGNGSTARIALDDDEFGKY